MKLRLATVIFTQPVKGIAYPSHIPSSGADKAIMESFPSRS